MADYYIAWWNLENLFDVENSTQREGYLKKALASELKGWNAAVLDQKVNCLAAVIKSMNQGKGPDILGVCEVEDQPVLAKLAGALKTPGRTYKTVHHDCKDQRGIEVAFIYDAALFDVNPKEIFSYFVLRRTGTRDIVQVTFRSAVGKNLLVVMGNHWPSRTTGAYETEPYRIIAGETLGYWHTRIVEMTKDPNVPILVMGDFNDEPFSRAITDYALCVRSSSELARAKVPRFVNLMWPLLGQGAGTYFFDGAFNMLDQFFVSKGLLNNKSAFSVKKDSLEIVRHGLDKPVPFGRPSKKGGINTKGASDHFPIAVVLREK